MSELSPGIRYRILADVVAAEDEQHRRVAFEKAKRQKILDQAHRTRECLPDLLSDSHIIGEAAVKQWVRADTTVSELSLVSNPIRRRLFVAGQRHSPRREIRTPIIRGWGLTQTPAYSRPVERIVRHPNPGFEQYPDYRRELVRKNIARIVLLGDDTQLHLVDVREKQPYELSKTWKSILPQPGSYDLVPDSALPENPMLLTRNANTMVLAMVDPLMVNRALIEFAQIKGLVQHL